MIDEINKLLQDKKQKQFEKDNEIYNKWYEKYGNKLRTDIINSLGNGQKHHVKFTDINLDINTYYHFYLDRFLKNEQIKHSKLFDENDQSYGICFYI